MRDRRDGWFVVSAGQPPLLLSARNPPDARAPGPVIGVGSEVRCLGNPRVRKVDRMHTVLGFEVRQADGTTAVGYTYAFMIRLPKRGRFGWFRRSGEPSHAPASVFG